MLPGIASALISGAKPTSWGNDAFTKLLLHFDGTVGSTYFPDSSPQGHPAASVGGIAKVGAGGLLGSSGCLNAIGGGGLAVLPSTDWDFGSGDFTVDWFEYRADNTDNRVAVARDNTSTTYQAFLFGLAVTGNLFVYCSGDGASWNVVSGMSLGPIELSVWHHFAVVRKGTIFYGFRDGVLQTSQASALALAPSSGALAIGYWGSPGVYFNGYMEELRISKGIARWTANFTPPTAPYGPDTKVVLITAGSTWTVPADWTNTGNSIECIGGGAGAAGGTGSNSGGAGGAGGGYSKIADLTLTPGAVINLNVGVGSPGQTSRVNSSAGGDTWFNGASLAASSVGAKGGGGATTGANPGSVGGIGGAAASGVGTTKFSGGNGGNFGGVAGGGGGGSGGPHGNGANGASSGSSQGGGGGGGNGGGSAAAAVSSASGSNGGNNYLGAGAGVGGVIAATRNGTAGVNGGGGGGGFYDTAASLGGVGGSPAEWTATANGATAGPGGGGGGGAGNNGNGGNGGGFGAGGGAGGAFTAGATGGNGTNGIIVVTYKGAGP